ncbi:glycosyltransferase family 8 protein [Paracoccus sp. 1_MG-2023]|uniref:glycosyltransferase family 8 protein n=1 Tax=unclassified Paracoccus (in: a-proteobacteria) TaxID=2688777 RepID=UPI001C08065F|nr:MULTISPECIES: glycosyltransferase family 8 protein [unclassified Paracoccus (in: a-proteobacteria)]MBU2958945.1 glycosyltransferase family 8 protein [Paracoccus sp. C2R09]MDO6669965.1 glycosyltransferase family 8 protein [Paracoccus sp. 1_MG-2023]
MTTMHVMMCANDAYAMPLTVAAHSLLRHADRDATIELHVVSDGISEQNRLHAEKCWAAAHPKVRAIWRQVDPAQFDSINFRHYSIVTLFRLLLPQLFPEDVERVLYMDCDIVVQRDIAELWRLDLEDKAVWAVQNGTDDDLENYVLSKFPEIEAVPDGRYFNAGVLLVNMAEWRRQQISDRTRDFLQKHSDLLGFPDQDALNAVLAGRWGRLHPRWNKQILRMGQPEAARPDDPGILHYTTRKPWTPEYMQKAKWAWHRAYLRSGWDGGLSGYGRTARLLGGQLWRHNRNRVQGRVRRLLGS